MNCVLKRKRVQRNRFLSDGWCEFTGHTWGENSSIESTRQQILNHICRRVKTVTALKIHLPPMTAARWFVTETAFVFLQQCVILKCLASLCVKVRASPWRATLASRTILIFIFIVSRAERQRLGSQTDWKWLCCSVHPAGAAARIWRALCAFCWSFSPSLPPRVVMLLRETTRRRKIQRWRHTRTPTMKQTPPLTERLSPSSPSTTTTSGSPLRSLCGSCWLCSWNSVSDVWRRISCQYDRYSHLQCKWGGWAVLHCRVTIIQTEMKDPKL